MPSEPLRVLGLIPIQLADQNLPDYLCLRTGQMLPVEPVLSASWGGWGRLGHRNAGEAAVPGP